MSFKKRFEKAFKRVFNSNGCESSLSESGLKNFIFKPYGKKLEAASFNPCSSWASFLSKLLIISIKQMNAIPLLSSV